MKHQIQFPIPFDVVKRFWSYVGERSSDPDACWEWVGALDRKGYGQIFAFNGRRRTHRLSWMIAFGPIPDGLCVCHKCDNRKCVRPAHFFLGTTQDNTADMFNKGRFVPCDGVQTTGEKNWNAKLTDDLVVAIRRRIRAGEKGRVLARELNLSESSISEAKNGRLWDHVNEREPPLKPWRAT